MKVIAALLIAAGAISLEPVMNGIPDGTLMDKNPSHWRKSWPEGDTDRGEGDEDTINLAGDGRKGPPKPAYKYVEKPWKLDENVVET